MFGASRSVSLYLALTVAIAMGAFLALTWYAASLENAAAEKRQTQIAQSATEQIFDDLSAKLGLMTYWQEAYDNTVVSWDTKWVNYEFGSYQDSVAVDAAIVADRIGEIKHLYQKPLPFHLDEKAVESSPQYVDLVHAVDTAPRRLTPTFSRGIVVIGGHVFFGVASRVTPERDTATFLRRPNRDIDVIYLRRTDASAYSALMKPFDIHGIQISARAIPGKASIALLDAAGGTPVRLWWQPERSGDVYLYIVGPLSLVLFLALVLVQAAVVRRWQAMLRHLYRVEASAEAVEAESRAKTAFLGVLSHELRTPLNAILGFAELAQSQIFGSLVRQYLEYLDHIQDGGKKMLRIVDDLLEIASIEARGVSLTPHPTSLTAALSHAIDQIKEIAARKEIHIALAAADPDIVVKFGDPQLSTVFVQIIKNAVNFSAEGTHVVVSARRNAMRAIVDVQDWGIGIGEDDLARLGHPFMQVEGHLARKNGGLGLGLAIAKRWVALMGGRLDIRSELGKGTTVTIALPVAEPCDYPATVVPQAA